MLACMQQERQAADHDPNASFSRYKVRRFVDESARVIVAFESAETRELRAFAVVVLFRFRNN